MTPTERREWNELNAFAVEFLKLEGKPYYTDDGTLIYKDLKKV